MRQIQADLDQYAKLKAKENPTKEEQAVIEAYIAVDEAEAAASEKSNDTEVAQATERLAQAQKELEEKPSDTV